MRKILDRNLTSPEWQQRDCVVSELMRQGDFVTQVIRRCTYNVASRVAGSSTADSIQWAKNLDPLPPRQVYVTKGINPDTGDEQVTYKVLGHFYIVLDREVFCIGYRHILSMNIEALANAES